MLPSCLFVEKNCCKFCIATLDLFHVVPKHVAWERIYCKRICCKLNIQAFHHLHHEYSVYVIWVKKTKHTACHIIHKRIIWHPYAFGCELANAELSKSFCHINGSYGYALYLKEIGKKYWKTRIYQFPTTFCNWQVWISIDFFFSFGELKKVITVQFWVLMYFWL